MSQLLLGDEAVGLAAADAGIAGVFSYPGTPATEIFEFVECLAPARKISTRWSTNEKVAYEAALGMSYVGKRALVSMKHVGLNVAADPFMSSALTGANGGLVVAVGDDPGMHSSQNEQDTRFYAGFARLPLFEPADPQEAYDMTRAAFELSERHSIPVMVRLVTRVAHSRGAVNASARSQPAARPAHGDWHHWTLLPPNARKRYARLLDLQPALVNESERSTFNQLQMRGRVGVIAAGIAIGYFCEAAGDDHDYSVLKIGAYPLPRALVQQLVAGCDEVLVLEDGYPLIEEQLKGLLGLAGLRVRGRLSGDVPRQGELSTEIVRSALKLAAPAAHKPVVSLPDRPPQLCRGCPHCDSYLAIVDAVKGCGEHYFFSDIGCYSLAALPPYDAIDTCVDMGASIGMAIGAARAGAHPVIATIGDSTFVHSGMTALVQAAHDDLNMTVVILDNALVAMTGGQQVFARGDELARIVLGLGVDPAHLVRIEPLAKRHSEQVDIIRRQIEHRGLSVIIASRPCIHAKRRSVVSERVTV